MPANGWPWFCGLKTYLRIVICLVVVILLLQGFHMIVLMRIQEKVFVARPSSTEAVNLLSLQTSLQEIIKEISHASIMDTSGVYMIVPNLIKPVESSSEIEPKVTICTQTTADHLSYLPELAATWNGPVSVSIFTHGMETPNAVYAMYLLHYCSESVRRHVTFHLVHPLSEPPLRIRSVLKKDFKCDKSIDLSHLKSFFKTDQGAGKKNYEKSDLPYPHNILRNVAISYSDTPYVLMTDIDFLPSVELKPQFENFLQRHSHTLDSDIASSENPPKAFVIPCFESKLTNFTAMTKEELITEWNKQNVRPFYSNICWKCQKVTDFDKWKRLPSVDFIEVGYDVEWEDPWEPFYIAKKSDLPVYDGRFKQYGFNRISQVCEMHIAGFKFSVLNNAFIVHHGYKEEDQFHARKQEENTNNRELFRSFKKELKERYPASQLEC